MGTEGYPRAVRISRLTLVLHTAVRNIKLEKESVVLLMWFRESKVSMYDNFKVVHKKDFHNHLMLGVSCMLILNLNYSGPQTFPVHHLLIFHDQLSIDTLTTLFVYWTPICNSTFACTISRIGGTRDRHTVCASVTEEIRTNTLNRSACVLSGRGIHGSDAADCPILHVASELSCQTLKTQTLTPKVPRERTKVVKAARTTKGANRCMITWAWKWLLTMLGCPVPSYSEKRPRR